MDLEAIGRIFGRAFEAVGTDGERVLNELGLPEGAVVLDVGTGNGKFATLLAAHGYQVVTGEPSTDQSHYAGQDWAGNAEKAGVRERIRFQAFDASRMPFGAGEFDGVFFFGVLHHIDEAVRRDVLRESMRVAKPGSPVVFFEPRQATLERLWVEDPAHPLAVNPSDYLPAGAAAAQHIEGSFMDIYIYQ